ncbi:MAG: type I-E CRISPR-associated protein Cas7/Cse4/CasC [Candidatus Eisenbacteria sp.]|nr:type I-E CRISPR-associated protein Cas7/Cse4/CasC [Candidatus Eisenbacteria bacterium]
MKLIELHILHSFPVTCLNRDDVGAPKSALFGGVPRARVSSQCWKRAIRELATELQPSLFAGKRGHYVAEPLQEKLVAEGVPVDKARESAEAVATFLGKQDKKHKAEHKTSVALYLSPLELRAIAKAIADEVRTGGKADVKKGAIKKAIEAAPPRDHADIAIFGRMVADDHTLMLEGAGMFSHALSTHGVSNEIDFFSAVDELKPEESEGAGHIGTLEFNSACYYRYIGLNWDLLCDPDHLGHFSEDERKKVAEAFLRACILAVPTARHNSMLGHNPPANVLALARSGQPLSLANAFEKPVRSRNGYVEESNKQMEDHFTALSKTYGIQATAFRIPDNSLDDLIEGVLGHA